MYFIFWNNIYTLMQQFDTEKLINNQYKLMTRIGRGSFGEVYKAINVESNELVGVKLVT